MSLKAVRKDWFSHVDLPVQVSSPLPSVRCALGLGEMGSSGGNSKGKKGAVQELVSTYKLRLGEGGQLVPHPYRASMCWVFHPVTTRGSESIILLIFVGDKHDSFFSVLADQNVRLWV